MQGYKRYYYFGGFLLIVCLVYIFVRLKSDSLQIENNVYTTVSFEKDTLHLGRVNIGETVSVTFKFINTGSTPLLIRNIRTTCGCTNVLWGKKPLLPQQMGSLKINFIGEHKGHFVKTIYVLCNVEKQFYPLCIMGDGVEK